MKNGNLSATDPQMDLFYNTAHLNQSELLKRKAEINKQNGKILKFFIDNPAVRLTPFEVQQYANLEHVPITSIRRALHTLTQQGELIKTDLMKPGEYGAMNHTWKKA